MNNSKNIAILFDVENLIGGYNPKIVADISLKKILLEIQQKNLGEIAILKAYGDWSHYKLSDIKWDVAELGIEPIQMLGFAKGAIKNASDIQLTIDVVDILYTKPFIDTFVIISGDGGFLSLVKKINSHGKKVIGCGNCGATNEVLSKVCDDFIYLENTVKKMVSSSKESILHCEDLNLNKAINENPILRQILPHIEPIEAQNKMQVKGQINLILEQLKQNREAASVLTHSGLNISVFKMAINYAFKQLKIFDYGYSKLIDFTYEFIKGSGVKLIYKAPSEYRFALETAKIPNYQDLDIIPDCNDLYSADFYKSILIGKDYRISFPENILLFQKVLKQLIHFEKLRPKFELIQFMEYLQQNETIISEIDLKVITTFLTQTGILQREDLSPENIYYGCTVRNGAEAKKMMIETLCLKLSNLFTYPTYEPFIIEIIDGFNLDDL